MGLAAGSRLGPYEVVGLLGAGGMGEVYRARDTKLGREVALKILPETLAADRDHLARFQREAQLLASLNHPHIGTIHGFEDSGPTRALVLELVEGPTLADRIAQGPIPIDETLPIATQIAEALESAHEIGIIHRDLKPANIKLRPDGTVKVLDFGLAKALGPEPAGEQAAQSPTVSLGATRAGIILGTAAYMAPEQARGRVVDKRADVWAFGAVLFEMLTGKRAFPGDDVSDTLATVLKSEPDWTLLPADTPASIRRLLRRCLVKDPKLRLRESGTAIVEIQEARDLPGALAPPSLAAAGPRSLTRALGWMGVALVAVAAAGFAAWRFAGAPPPPRPEVVGRFQITIPEGDELSSNSGSLLAISPDGRTIVYKALRAGAFELFVRPLGQLDSKVLPGTTNVSEPVLSPDGSSIAFVSIGDGTIKKLPLAGGAAVTLGRLTPARGVSWAGDGRIFVGSNASGGPLLQVPDGGGEPTQLLKLDGHRLWYPQLLPGGRALLVTVAATATPDGTELHLLDLATGGHRRLIAEADAGRLLGSGHLVFLRQRALWATRVDPATFQPVGDAIPVIDQVRAEAGGAVQFDVSDSGTLIYVPDIGTGSRTRRLIWADGKRVEPIAGLPQDFGEVALSPDRTRAAVQIGTGSIADVWVADLTRGTLTRITSEDGFDGSPVWSPDGASVVYSTGSAGQRELRRKPADGTGQSETLVRFEAGVVVARPQSWSPDGSTLVFDYGVERDINIGMLGLADKGAWRELVRTPASEARPAVSPDGRWIAYESNETGAAEIYVQRFPGGGNRRLISVGGGFIPTWRRDGTELVYLQPRARGGGFGSNLLVRVPVRTAGDGALPVGAVQPGPIEFAFFNRPGANRLYDLAPDGRLLLMSVDASEGSAAPSQRQINVVLSWFEELNRVLPPK